MEKNGRRVYGEAGKKGEKRNSPQRYREEKSGTRGKGEETGLASLTLFPKQGKVKIKRTKRGERTGGAKGKRRDRNWNRGLWGR